MLIFGFKISWPWVWSLISIFFYAIVIYILGLIAIKFIDFSGSYGSGYDSDCGSGYGINFFCSGGGDSGDGD